ncbi:MAG: transglycosylase SLT domain-containing protein [Blastocatellia bacterium]|jgi:soluble lytic murein transglycosylase-like protein/Kef-type K+ transport system membrane component KefB
MQQIIPITTLLLGAMLVLLAARLMQRRNLSGATALSLSLCGVALGLALIPANWQAWLAGGETGDRVLTFARELGLTGLFFFAGTRFDLKEVWQARRVSLFVGVSGLLLFSLTAVALLLLGQSGSTAVTAAAAIVGTSVWLPSQFSLASERGAVAAAPFKGAGAALTLLSLVALHFYAVFYALSDRAMNRSAWIVVALYEATKLAVFFSSAYFAASSFLSRSDGPSARTLIGYALIVVLVFVLALSVVGQVGALAWALASGALLGSSKTGRKMRESQQSAAAVVVFLSFAFLPLLLQAHGRQLTDVPLIFFAVIAALTYKFAVVWGGARVAGASSADAGRIAAVTLASGEIGILVLGFSYTRWLVESELFYGILSYAFISLLISPVLWRLFASFDDQLTVSQLTDTGHEQKVSRRRQTVVSVAMVVACLLTLASGARAQAASTTKEEDPVARARAMIGNMVDERAAAAERVLTAAKLVNESVAARQEGRLDQAKEALVKAERVMTEAATVRHNLLAEELLRRLAEEQAMLNPKPAALLLPPATDYLLVPKVPRLVVARYQTYRDTFTRILVEERVPIELLAVAFVESGFNPQALSPKGARGIWQFMPETAKRYGLPVRPADDHRTHPEHSTRAAARYLRDLYQQFRDWKLALAAYNAGETRVQRIIDQTGIRNFDEMARRGLLPLETRNYVPAVLAVWSQLSGRSADGKARDHFGWKVPKRTETN